MGKRLMAAPRHTPIVDGAVCTFHDAWVEVVGTPEALEADDLILREWLPIAPKRLHWQMEESARDWDDPLRDRDAVGGRELRRVAGGLLHLRLWPLYCRTFLGGPTDTKAPQRTLARLRALVRARRDERFRAFLAAVA